MKHSELLSEPRQEFSEFNLLLGNITFMEFHKDLLILINFVIKWVQTIFEGHYDSVKSILCIFQNIL